MRVVMGVLFCCLLLTFQSVAVAQTPDGETPAEEDVCVGLSGASWGLCNAYCEAMDCDSGSPQASLTACDKVYDKFLQLEGQLPPCILPPDPIVCGGIAGLECPAEATCVDLPTDNCDPDCGGADCAGICVETSFESCGGFAGFPCPEGFNCFDHKGDQCSPFCGGADCSGICVAPFSPDNAELSYFTTCPDPVCSGFDPGGLDLCTTETPGETCTSEGSLCAIPNDGCNVAIVCAAEDPATGCPISRRSFKRDINYLTDKEIEQYSRELLSIPLASYRYKDTVNGTGTRLGFIIEDVEPSPSVHTEKGRVDLYGYVSMAVATLQAQQRRMEALEAELAELRRQMLEASEMQ